MSSRSESNSSVDLLVQGGLYLLVGSIPFEYPERTIPLEIPTLTGAVFLLFSCLHPGRCYGRIPAAVLWFGVYLLAFLLSMAAGGEHLSEAGSEFIVVLQGLLVMLAAGNLMANERIATRAMVTLVAACTIRATLPFIGFARTSDVVWTGGERVSALGQNANSAAMILAAGMVALIGLSYGRRSRSPRRLLLTAALATLLGTAVLETGSRGGLLALLGGVLVFALATHEARARLRNVGIALAAIALLVVGTLHLPVMRNRWEDSVRNGNLAGREQLYPALWTMFLEKPVLGWGPVTNTYELAARIGERERPHRASHNIVLELLTATGLIGTVPFILAGLLCARQAWQARQGALGILPLALCGSVFISNMSGDWIASKLIWIVLAFAVASTGWSTVAQLDPHSERALSPVRTASAALRGGY
jgi:O-antigen ligase